MAGVGPEFAQEAPPEGGEFGIEQVKELLGLFARAPRRHPRLAILALVLTLAIGFTAVAIWPRSYSCSVRMLAQKNMLLPALGNQNTSPDDHPTRNVADTILQRENMVATIKQLDLMDRWEATRAPVLRFKDRVFGLLGTRSEDDKLLDMIATLETKLLVLADETSITISIEWPDRNLSYEIVTFLQKNFLDARYDKNVSVVGEAIRILQERAKPQAAEVDAALADLTKVEAERGAALGLTGRGATVGSGASAVRRGWGGRRATPSPAGSAAAPSAGGGTSTDDAVAELEEVRRRIRLYKEDRDRQLLQAQAQLSDARATLGPLHPTVVALNEKIAQLSGENSPDLQALATRERQLVAQIAKATVPAPAPSALVPAPGPAVGVDLGSPPPAASTVTSTSSGSSLTELQQDPEVAVALNRCRPRRRSTTICCRASRPRTSSST
jgi:hypothetical protein